MARSEKVCEPLHPNVMSFRKNNQQECEKRLPWKRFCDVNRDLIERTGLTTPTIETQERFEDFLMHGYIDHHDDWSEFTFGHMDTQQFKWFKVLVGKYFEAGYYDPGLLAVGHYERIRLAHKYPQQFNPDFADMMDTQDEE